MYLDYEEIACSSDYLGINLTVFQPECNWLIAGCHLVEASGMEGCVNFKTDNQALVQSLASHLVITKMVEDTRKALNSLAKKRKVTVGWICSHVGYVGNERADELAKTGSEERLTGCEPSPQKNNK